MPSCQHYSEEKDSIISLVGLILVVIGIGFSCFDVKWWKIGIGIGLAGMGILAFALFTGKLKFLD